ncbi:GNAT family N-acetyltransferase [Halobacillus litoralis]|uniref:GNAT family N-acetyltransferase n=1 Tax=Halobacillus litoralis TaxID=45668 RepID=UPI001CD7829F|nr:N-acetyltransferase [Halobacillus litoralis]MCA1020965.1 GNAT family N-acetyltransferase [Halobacillus litoralis]
MKIRKLESSEYDRVLSFTHQMIYEGTMRTIKVGQEQAKTFVQPVLDEGGTYIIAENEQGQLLGWLLSGEKSDTFSGETFGFIYELFVLPEFRGREIGRALMEEGISRLQQQYREIRLSVYAGNDASNLYESLGFQKKTITMSLTKEEKGNG